MAKKKNPPKAKSDTKSAKAAKDDTTASEAGAARRVARTRDKLAEAMQDPLTRDQIVRAIRALMQEK